MDNNTMLRSLFLAGISSKAMKIRLGEDLYMVSTNSVYQGPPTDNEKTMLPGKAYAVQGMEMLTVTDANRVRPEVFLDTMRVPMGAYATAPYFMLVKSPVAGFSAGVWALKEGEETGVYELLDVLPVEQGEESFNEMGICLTSVPSYMIDWLADHGKGLSDFGPVITRSKVPAVPVVLLTSDVSILFTSMCVGKSDPPYKLQINLPDGNVVDGDGYSPDSKTWKKLKTRSKKMIKGLASPLVSKKEIKKAVETPVNGTVAPVTEPAVTPVSVETPADTIMEEAGELIKVSEEEVAAAAALTETPQEQLQVCEQEAATVEEKQPKRRQRPQKAVGLDLTKVIEEVSAPVDTLSFEQFESASQEIRSLRDLVIAAARRIANISAEMTKLSTVAVDKYKAVQDLFKK